MIGLGFIAVLVSPPSQIPLLGLWLTKDRDAEVRLAPCAADAHLVCGSIEKILDPSEIGALDDNNPDPGLRMRHVEGITILSHFRLTSGPQGTVWQDGQAYDPDKGKTYSGLELRLQDSRHLVLSKSLNLAGVKATLSEEVWTRLGN